VNDVLGPRIQPTDYRGDIHLTSEEREWFDQVEEARGAASAGAVGVPSGDLSARSSTGGIG
jgi:hypothetical protein